VADDGATRSRPGYVGLHPQVGSISLIGGLIDADILTTTAGVPLAPGIAGHPAATSH
jgi:hypothetical protein